jgi:MYXO-CTERM domain-containing protein
LAVAGWTPIDSSRPVWRRFPVPFAMTNPGSADLGAATTEMEVQRGMLDWTRVSCTSLTASYSGSVTTRPRAFDGVSVIGWTESGWPHDSGAIGVTSPQWGGSGIGEADMEMNGVNFTWITGSGRGGSVNAYSIILHEGGHYYGLGHSSDPSATMYFAYSGGIDSLGTDDTNGICALYPGMGTDCTTTGCPAGQECVGGSCMAVMGDGDTCSPCTDGSACTNGICLGYPDGGGYCGHTCRSGADCGAGEMCLSITGIPAQCVRFTGGTPSCAGGPTGCTSDSDCAPTETCNRSTGACVMRPTTGTTPLGGACGDSSECQSALCFAGVCSQSCDGLDPTSCPGGFYCNGQIGGTCTEGLCVAGSAGGGAPGDACGANTDCASLFCFSGACSTPCIPGGAVGCAEGFACQVGATPTCGGCVTDRGGIGDPCAMSSDCASSLCATASGMSFCTALCDPAAAEPCAPGFDCVDAGGINVCAPGSGSLGSACGDNAECVSGICAMEGTSGFCTRLCDAANPCPMSFSCVEAGEGTRVCRPANRGGCGCRVGAGGTGPAALLGLGGVIAVLALRRRR